MRNFTLPGVNGLFYSRQMPQIDSLSDFQIIAGIIALTPGDGEAAPVPMQVVLARLRDIASTDQPKGGVAKFAARSQAVRQGER